jgi:hypothetical protein
VASTLRQHVLAVDRRREVDSISGAAPPPSGTEAYVRAMAVLDGLSELGLVLEADKRRWVAEIERAADPEASPLRSYEVAAVRSRAGKVRVSGRVGESHARVAAADPYPQCSFEEWSGVLAVPPPVDDSSARVTAIEWFRDGFVLHWTEPPTRDSYGDLRRHFRVEVADEDGTAYLPCGGHGGASSTERSHRTRIFAPGLRPGTARLVVRIGDEEFVIALPE